ncbi:hypothetical protein C5167_014357, partial [Papaver somniferum]
NNGGYCNTSSGGCYCTGGDGGGFCYSRESGGGGDGSIGGVCVEASVEWEWRLLLLDVFIKYMTLSAHFAVGNNISSGPVVQLFESALDLFEDDPSIYVSIVSRNVCCI